MCEDKAETRTTLDSGMHLIDWYLPHLTSDIEVRRDFNEKEVSITMLVPWIEERPFDPAPLAMSGWPNIISGKDNDHAGFIYTVNILSGFVETDWMLIWNSDAFPRFTAEQMYDAISEIPDEATIVAPIKMPNPDMVPVTSHSRRHLPREDHVRRQLYWNIMDTGPLAVSGEVPVRTELRPGWGEVAGTAYSPLYAVRTVWFRKIGGLPTLYGKGYFEDADMWRRSRRFGGKTFFLPRLEYEHKGEESFKSVFPSLMRKAQVENLRRYLLLWGGLEPTWHNIEGEGSVVVATASEGQALQGPPPSATSGQGLIVLQKNPAPPAPASKP